MVEYITRNEQVRSSTPPGAFIKQIQSLLLPPLPPEDPKIMELLNEISLRNQELEAAAFGHFRKVRALSDEEQKKEFDKIIGRIPDMTSHGKPPPPPPRRPGPGRRPEAWKSIPPTLSDGDQVAVVKTPVPHAGPAPFEINAGSEYRSVVHERMELPVLTARIDPGRQIR